MNQPAGISFAVIVNVRAETEPVNSQKMVQKEIFRSGIDDASRQVQSAESRTAQGF
jgi:hypothetical protein